MKYLVFLLIVISSCKVSGPSYQGSSHNDQLKRNKSVVYKQDLRMKKTMSKQRKRSARLIKHKMRHVRSKNRNKYIR